MGQKDGIVGAHRWQYSADKSSRKTGEVKNYLIHDSYRNYFLFVMGINIGLRISDLLPLQVKDVKKTHITIVEKKTKKPKRFLINTTLRHVIEEYIQDLDDDDYLFPSQRTNKHIKRVQAYKILNKAAKRQDYKR